MTISYATRAAIAALPGKTVARWKDGDPGCHCTHCDLCGELYRTEDIGAHEGECQAALIVALDRSRAVDALDGWAHKNRNKKASYWLRFIFGEEGMIWECLLQRDGKKSERFEGDIDAHRSAADEARAKAVAWIKAGEK